ncbi:GntR family transcriptional regulator [Falsiroseomonas selenitidurans]|uniref:GntR family transcriptional regulator n=1 Tax=Falsiroseomonas selenitidurans TaxID=2716335 RepID=A0ABX1E6Y7_9PROT|nr:GntR family transcriptional regulator [Falsiroseomonas selenitidurans]NKC32969.1 GntR family transcriptional regulator [Falsiroseomonas selenitidurans]
MPRPRLAALDPPLLNLPPPDRSRPAPDQLYRALRAAILRLDLPPGAPVPEPAIAAQAGVSRTPVREALRRLREEGLVDIFPNLGSFVSRLSVAQLDEAVALRELLEAEAVGRLAANPGSATLPLLRRILAEQRAAAAEGDRDRVYALDDAFHAQIFAAAALPLMWSACRAARAHLERVHHAAVADLARAEAAIAAHAAILDRIAAADPPGARAAMAAHVRANAADLAALGRLHPGWLA